MLYYGSGMHTLNGSLGQFARSNTLQPNLHHNQLNYPSFLSSANAHKPLNYTYHSASTHHSYPYTSNVLGSHRSTSGQSLLPGGTNNQLYQTGASAYTHTTGNPNSFNAHGPPLIHHLPTNNANLPPTNVIGAPNANLSTGTHTNHPLQFTNSTLSAGSAESALQSAQFASLPRTAQSLPNTPNVARRSLSPQPSFFALPMSNCMMTTNPTIQPQSAATRSATSNLCRTNSGGNPNPGRYRLDHPHYNERNNPFIAPLDLAGEFFRFRKNRQ